MFEIRYLAENEKDFLLEMLYESIYIEKEKKPPINELLNTNELKKYHQNWGRKGDRALIAVDNKGTPVGAVWHRLFNIKERGYGYVNDTTPELGIAVIKEARGKGLGTKLMYTIIEQSKNDYSALSLSVDVKNTDAVNLYHKFGFVEVKKEGNSITMLLK
ncbi:GNAT family N-acetyltransferase [Halalkalibacter hemicellulosilyticus]|uniref:Putative acetyltransferase n=1 Tax=Halalkalibacter hemicellulosilyticusJCM 9152 TaxID=1236971 RepID=W4QMM2_9BACI|nr:GNAT family N-acetyltransferase [Halalkalibacter hemicellulosilyticus]GAE32893.1 putative acetyltransferase [Halalkalibacter hemicellulosilyticusJCM 9152]